MFLIQTPKGDPKAKTGSAMKKTPTRGASITPAPVVTPTGEPMTTPDSPPPSPILDVDPLVEKKYKEKLHTQVCWQSVSSCLTTTNIQSNFGNLKLKGITKSFKFQGIQVFENDV